MLITNIRCITNNCITEFALLNEINIEAIKNKIGLHFADLDKLLCYHEMSMIY